MQKFSPTIKRQHSILANYSQGYFKHVASDGEHSGEQCAAVTITNSTHFGAQYAVRTIIDSLQTGLQLAVETIEERRVKVRRNRCSSRCEQSGNGLKFAVQTIRVNVVRKVTQYAVRN